MKKAIVFIMVLGIVSLLDVSVLDNAKWQAGSSIEEPASPQSDDGYEGEIDL
ncbi:MAG: hypothetical protein IJP92_12660 [Lachnospiraceae bacterium]|nr:hypothetical protein [Lachnospiraceae bacterium]